MTWRPLLGLVAAWATPAVLLAVPTALIATGADGLWLGLLFVAAPLFASLALPTGRAGVAERSHALPLVLALLVVGLLVWANLSLAGDLAAWMGWPRWRGIVPAAAAALGLVLWPGASRRWPWLVAAGLLALAVPLAALAQWTHAGPIATWRHLASEAAFRFSPDSPWVTEGRVVGSGRGAAPLVFEEEHRLTPVDAGPLRVEVSDRGRRQFREWTLTAGQSVTLRPGDRLQLDGPRRLKFEADKRIPGAPASGIAWAAGRRGGRAGSLLRAVGLGITLIGGAAALGGLSGSAAASRLGAASAGLALLAFLAWGECWAIYTVRWAPEVFLGGVSAASLLELPALVLRGSPWGPRLAAMTLGGLAALFLAGGAALREHLARAEGRAGGALASDTGLWGGVFAVTALAAAWPLPPWSLALAGLGLAASTLAPLALVGSPVARPGAATGALWVGLGLFAGLSAAEELGVLAGPLGQVAEYPALVAAPVVAVLLRVAGRPARA